MEYYDIHEFCISNLMSSSFADKKFKKNFEAKWGKSNQKMLRILLKLTLKGI